MNFPRPIRRLFSRKPTPGELALHWWFVSAGVACFAKAQRKRLGSDERLVAKATAQAMDYSEGILELWDPVMFTTWKTEPSVMGDVPPDAVAVLAGIFQMGSISDLQETGQLSATNPSEART
jgi:hypothetical protein